MSSIDSSFFVLEHLDDLQNVSFDFFDVFGVNEGSHFDDEFHENGDSIGANERKSYSEVRVVLLQSDFLQIFLNPFVNLVRDLSIKHFTAFSGKKRKSLNMSRTIAPNGMISITAKI